MRVPVDATYHVWDKWKNPPLIKGKQLVRALNNLCVCASHAQIGWRQTLIPHNDCFCMLNLAGRQVLIWQEIPFTSVQESKQTDFRLTENFEIKAQVSELWERERSSRVILAKSSFPNGLIENEVFWLHKIVLLLIIVRFLLVSVIVLILQVRFRVLLVFCLFSVLVNQLWLLMQEFKKNLKNINQNCWYLPWKILQVSIRHFITLFVFKCEL